jgi:hypothetical protein
MTDYNAALRVYQCGRFLQCQFLVEEIAEAGIEENRVELIRIANHRVGIQNVSLYEIDFREALLRVFEHLIAEVYAGNILLFEAQRQKMSNQGARSCAYV